MFRNLFFGLLLVAGFGLTLSSCTPGIYGGTSVGVGYAPSYYGGYGPGYYGGGYGYGPRYYGGYGSRVIVNPRPIIVSPRASYGGGYRGNAGYHGGGGYRGGYGGGGGRRGGR